MRKWLRNILLFLGLTAAILAVVLPLASLWLNSRDSTPPETSVSEQASPAAIEAPPPAESSAVEPVPVDYALDPRIPAEIRGLITENRRDLFLPQDDDTEERLDDLLTTGLDAETDKAVAARMQSVPPDTAPATLTLAQARADVDFLFDFLKYGYCGYGYLGGDAVFLPVKAEILAELDARPEPVATVVFQDEILVPALAPVVVDNHFMVGDTSFARYHSRRYLCLNEEAAFQLEDGVFRSADGYVLQSVNGEPPADWMLPVLTAEGGLAWAPGAMTLAPEAITATLSLQEPGGNLLAWDLTLPPADTAYRQELDRDTAYNRYDLDGIPVLENRHLEAAAADDFLDRMDPALLRLVEDAPKLRDEPVFILDLRGNRGGDDYYACRWLEEYAGINEIEYYGAVVTTLMSDTVYYSDPLFPEYFQEAYEEAEAGGSLPGWVETHILAPNRIENDSVVFVLIDGFVASSGESFVALLREMDNVVIVGTATAGMGTMGNIRNVALPESQTRIQCGVTLFLPTDLSPFEGVGYRPDLWVPPGEGLERITAFIRRCLETP